MYNFRAYFKVQKKLASDALQKEIMPLLREYFTSMDDILNACVEEILPLVKEPTRVKATIIFLFEANI